jgi:hypothetical protein
MGSKLETCLKAVKAGKDLKEEIIGSIGADHQAKIKSLISEADEGLDELRTALKDQHGIDLPVRHLDDGPPGEVVKDPDYHAMVTLRDQLEKRPGLELAAVREKLGMTDDELRHLVNAYFEKPGKSSTQHVLHQGGGIEFSSEAPAPKPGENEAFGGSAPVGEDYLPTAERFTEAVTPPAKGDLRKRAEEMIPSDATPEEVRQIVEGARASWAKVRAHDEGNVSIDRRVVSTPTLHGSPLSPAGGERAMEFSEVNRSKVSALARAKPGEWADDYLSRTSPNNMARRARAQTDSVTEEEELVEKVDGREIGTGSEQQVSADGEMVADAPRSYMEDLEDFRQLGRSQSVNTHLGGDINYQARHGKNILGPAGTEYGKTGPVGAWSGNESSKPFMSPEPRSPFVPDAPALGRRPALAVPSMTGVRPASIDALSDAQVRALAIDIAKSKGYAGDMGWAERASIDTLRRRVEATLRPTGGKSYSKGEVFTLPSEYAANAWEAVVNGARKVLDDPKAIGKAAWKAFRSELIDNTVMVRDVLSKQAGVSDIRDIIELAKAGKIGTVEAQAYYALRQQARLGKSVTDMVTHGLRAAPKGVDRADMVFVWDEATKTVSLADAKTADAANVISLHWVTAAARNEQDLMDAAHVAMNRHLETGRLRRDVLDFDDAKLKKVESEMKIMEHDPERLARAQGIADRMRAFSQASLDMALDAGLIDAGTHTMWRKLYPDHFGGLQRVAKNSGDILGNFTNASLPFNKAVGSSRQIEHPLVNMMNNYARIYQAALKNNARQLLLNALEKGGLTREMNIRSYWKHTTDPHGNINAEFQEAEILDATKPKEPSGGAMQVFRDGETRYYEIKDADLMADLKKMSEGSALTNNIFGKVLSGMAGLTRWTVTHSPAFAIRNLIKDFQHRLLLSPTMRGQGIGAAASSMRDGITNDPERRAFWRAHGGDQAGFYAQDREAYGALMKQELKGKLGKNSVTLSLDGMNNLASRVTELGETYADWVSRTEEWGRMAEFEAAMKALRKTGIQDERVIAKWGAFMSADILDYSVHGNFIKHIAPFVPFLNAAIQGSARMFRELTVAGKFNKELAAKWGMYCVAPEVAVYALNKAMGTDEEWHELPAYQKDMFYNIKVPMTDNLWLRIPKPYELGVLASGVGRTLDATFGNHGQDWGTAFQLGSPVPMSKTPGWLSSVRSASIPTDMGALAGPFKVIFEGITNYNFFKGSHIVSPFEERLDVRLRQGTKNATAVAQTFQNVMGAVGISMDARMVDNFGQGMLGDFWRVPSTIGDAAGGEGHVGKARVLNSMFGVFAQTPGAAATSVEAGTNAAAALGMQRKRDVNAFREEKNALFATKSDSEYEARARSLRATGRQVEKTYSGAGIFKQALDKANAKAEALR